MKILKVQFHSDVRVPKPIPGYGGSTSGISSSDKMLITWEPGDNVLLVDVKDDPRVVVIPLYHVSSMEMERPRKATAPTK